MIKVVDIKREDLPFKGRRRETTLNKIRSLKWAATHGTGTFGEMTWIGDVIQNNRAVTNATFEFVRDHFTATDPTLLPPCLVSYERRKNFTGTKVWTIKFRFDRCSNCTSTIGGF